MIEIDLKKESPLCDIKLKNITLNERSQCKFGLKDDNRFAQSKIYAKKTGKWLRRVKI